jgi:hypothetical protein
MTQENHDDGVYYVEVAVDEILDDPGSLLLDVTTVEVGYAEPKVFTVDDKVEVSGFYWKRGLCPAPYVQYCGRVQASEDSYYIELASQIGMGTSFGYRGQLLDAGSAADGIYDLQFRLYDAAGGGNQAASTLDVGDVEVVAGFFAVTLDFGSDVFDGNRRWLEVGVRPGDSADKFTVLRPRQQITPVPYALQTRGIFVDDAGNVGMGTKAPACKLDVGGDIHASGAVAAGARTLYLNATEDAITSSSGKIYIGREGGSFEDVSVGIGTTAPARMANLDVGGRVHIGKKLQVSYGPPGSDGPAIYAYAADNIPMTHIATKAGVYAYGQDSGMLAEGPGGTGVRAAGKDGGVEGVASDLGGIGVKGVASNSGNWVNYGGYFEANGTYGDGVCGEAKGSDGAGVHGKHGSSGNEGKLGGKDFGVRSHGDLVVHGAFRGTIGPQNGAPFPRPAYDSGWRHVGQGQTLTLTHALGGDPDNYVVDLQFLQPGAGGTRNQMGYGGYNWGNLLDLGAQWRRLTERTIDVYRLSDDVDADRVRVRIWVYK